MEMQLHRDEPTVHQLSLPHPIKINSDLEWVTINIYVTLLKTPNCKSGTKVIGFIAFLEVADLVAITVKNNPQHP